MLQNDLSVNAGAASRADVDRIESALSCLAPDCPRERWVQIGQAIHAALGDDGFDLWDQWSKGGSTYEPNSARDAWKSFKKDGGIGPGTLFFLAKEAGWMDDAPGTRIMPTAKEAKTTKDKAAGAQQKDTKRAREWYQKASRNVSNHPYLLRKGLKQTSLLRRWMYLNHDCLMVPMFDQAGQVTGLQFIAGDRVFGKPGSLRDKTLLKDCAAGLFPLGPTFRDASQVVICEGLAAGDAITQATGLPVVVACGKGNLKRIALWVRDLAAPGADIIIAADDDQPNPDAINKANDAAKACAGRVALPTMGKKADFWDLFQEKGPEAVLAAIEAAQAPAPAQTEAPKRKTALPHGYYIDADGLHYLDESNPEKPVTHYLGPQLEVVGRVRSTESKEWGFELRWKDYDGVEHDYVLSNSALADKNAPWLKEMAALGWLGEPGAKQKQMLTTFFARVAPTERARGVDRTGWQDGAFVLPDAVVGESKERLVLQGVGGVNPFTCAGTLDGWKNTIGERANGNDLLMFCISASLAAPLVEAAGMDSGGLHMWWNSSTGKTTLLRAARSVWGPLSGMRTWDGTKVGLEGTVALFNDSLLCLDEIGQASSKVVGSSVYMLSNGQGKLRGQTDGSARALKSWRVLILSSGEMPLRQKLREDGQTAKGGQEVRIVDIPACLEGVTWQNLHGHSDPGAFSDSLVAAAEENYGLLGRAWLEILTKELRQGLKFRANCDEIAMRLIDELRVKEGQERRVLGRFALIAAAGELAVKKGLVPWGQGTPTMAALSCARAWLADRGRGSQEDRRAIDAVKSFIARFGRSRFQEIDGPGQHDRILDRAGFRRSVNGKTQFLFLQEQLGDVLQDIGVKRGAKALDSAGMLRRLDSERMTQRVAIPDLGRARVYVVEIELDEDAINEVPTSEALPPSDAQIVTDCAGFPGSCAGCKCYDHGLSGCGILAPIGWKKTA
jgi:putative DNA primase/helicase